MSFIVILLGILGGATTFGFIGVFLGPTLLAVGVLLDATGEDYRIAFSSVFVLQVLGVSRILSLRGRALARERDRRGPAPVASHDDPAPAPATA